MLHEAAGLIFGAAVLSRGGYGLNAEKYEVGHTFIPPGMFVQMPHILAF